MKTLQKSKLISIPIIFLLSLGSMFGQIRPNRFTTNGDPGAWVFTPMQQLSAYANGTNFSIDWTTNAYRINATGDICFQYSTNWGLAGTNRFANLYIPATNIFRRLLFQNAATNWHDEVRPIVAVPTGYAATIRMNSFGSGETNVTYTPDIDCWPVTTNWQGQFSPSSIGGLVLWIEASQQIYQDEFGLAPVTASGQLVRYAQDLAGIAGKMTNGSISTSLYYRGPNDSIGNIPCLEFLPGQPSYLVSTQFTAITQPNWAFIMNYGRGNGTLALDGLSEGNRFACQLSQTPAIAAALYSGTSLTFTPLQSRGWRLFTFEQNTTSSIIRTNGVQVASGNSGTQTPSRWVIGTDYNLGSQVGDTKIAEILVYHGSLTAGQVTNIESYLWNKYGTPHP